MKSSLRMLGAKTKPPVPIGTSGGTAGILRGHSFNLGNGRSDNETAMRQYGLSGTVFSIVSLLAESSASTTWHLYKKPPQDGRVRYTTSDKGSDQRIEVVQHAAIQLWNCPNPFNSGFEFREASQQHQELTGETFWVLDNESGIPTAMYYVRPDRMTPIADEDHLLGWMYTGPEGQQVPLDADQVILEKRPDPLDPYRGSGPVASILPNIQQQRYATEYQRNLFLNGANPGGIIQLPTQVNEHDFDQMVDRWRESHRGVARAGHVAILDNGATWTPAGQNNKDMEYGQLRLANRDELREAWRIHKSMLGSSEDVNRANAQTAEEVFVAWQVMPRLNRRRDTLNSKLLPLFGAMGQNVEFDYEDPSPVNAETAVTELVGKATAAQALVSAGYDPSDVLEVVGLPDMDFAKPAATQPPPAGLTQMPESTEAGPENRESITVRNNAATKAFEAEADRYPADAVAWMHHADWKGPVEVPLGHIDWTPKDMEGHDPSRVQHFVDKILAGKKIKPVILVKTPGKDKLRLVDGHHRYLAAAQVKQPVRAFVGTVDSEKGPWDDMHTQQDEKVSNAATMTKDQVNYRDAANPERSCGDCAMFRAPHGCTLVQGYIRTDGVCDKWAPEDDGMSLSSLLRVGLMNGYQPVNGTAVRKVDHG